MPLDQFGFREWRKWATARCTGRVLEIGVGTGLNLPYYDRAARIYAIDPDEEILGEVEHWDKSLTFARLVQGSAMDLPFPDCLFDSVVGTLVFCSIRDASQALLEVKRVMKPGAPLRLVEHVRAKNALVGGLMDAAAPIWERMTGGCHLNRNTYEVVRSAGFEIESLESRWFGMFLGIDAHK